MTQNKSTSVLIAGAGGVGLSFAYLIKDLPGVEIGVLARSNYEVIKEQISVIDPGKNNTHSFKVDPSRIFNEETSSTYNGEPYDYIFVAAKVITNYAVPYLDRFAGPNTVIILAQNGVDIEEPYLKAYPKIPLISGVVRVAVGLTGPSELTYYSYGRYGLNLGLVEPYNTDSDKIDKLTQFVDLASKAGIAAKIEDDIAVERWKKVVSNGTFNNSAAILNLSVEDIIKSGSEKLLYDIMNEIWQVGLAKFSAKRWTPIEEFHKLITWHKTRDDINGFVPSTLQDVRRGKEIEYRVLSGNVIKEADELNIKVPVLKTIFYSLQTVNYRVQKYGY